MTRSSTLTTSTRSHRRPPKRPIQAAHQAGIERGSPRQAATAPLHAARPLCQVPGSQSKRLLLAARRGWPTRRVRSMRHRTSSTSSTRWPLSRRGFTLTSSNSETAAARCRATSRANSRACRRAPARTCACQRLPPSWWLTHSSCCANGSIEVVDGIYDALDGAVSLLSKEMIQDQMERLRSFEEMILAVRRCSLQAGTPPPPSARALSQRTCNGSSHPPHRLLPSKHPSKRRCSPLLCSCRMHTQRPLATSTSALPPCRGCPSLKCTRALCASLCRPHHTCTPGENKASRRALQSERAPIKDDNNNNNKRASLAPMQPRRAAKRAGQRPDGRRVARTRTHAGE